MLKQSLNLLSIAIETSRLVLTPVSMDYKEDVFREFDKETTKYMGPKPAEDITETEAFVNSSRENMAKGEELVCYVLKKDTKEFIGVVGLHHIDTATPELGCWVKKSAHGNKYGREAIHALKQWADENVDYEYLTYPVAAANIASRKIPESLGGVVAREFMGKNGKGVEMPEVEYRIYKTPHLTDGIIILRPFRLEDIKAHIAGDDELSIKWLNDGHKSTFESTKQWIERNQVSWEQGGPVFNFAIEEASFHALIGMVEANIDYATIEGCEPGDANISYALYPTARGKGYSTRAVNLLLDFLQSKNVQRAVIRINPENSASLGVPVRCGFIEKGIIRTKEGEVMKVFCKMFR